jgi:hypothetical protein
MNVSLVERDGVTSLHVCETQADVLHGHVKKKVFERDRITPLQECESIRMCLMHVSLVKRDRMTPLEACESQTNALDARVTG